MKLAFINMNFNFISKNTYPDCQRRNMRLVLVAIKKDFTTLYPHEFHRYLIRTILTDRSTFLIANALIINNS